ncbi:MAG: carboxypeptidase regulatory-like domain-containing protein [Acidobacteriota bacterium]
MHIGRRCGILAILVSGMLFLLGSGEVFCATTRSLYYGRSLVEVLQELQSNGLNVIFSSAVVHGRILVTVEPSATEPRAILDEILSPLGLEARDGPGHSILIVRAPGGSDTGILRGRVVSAARGAPIGGATVKIMETPDHATTLPDGTFEIRHVAPGTYEVSVEASGFLPWSSRPVHLEPHATRGLAVYMEAQPTYLEEVVVTPSRLSLVQQDQTSRLTISDDDMVLAPTFGGDISRVIESLPGVTAPDNSAAFNVRGSQARDVSIVLDGLELYEPFHLLRFQSPFSLVDSEIVERIDFTGGAFTADHGDRLGGVVEVSTWAPDDPHRAHVGVGTLNSRVSYGGPIAGQPASWLASARAWYPESIRDSVELGETGIDPRFEDAYFSLSRNVSPKTVLSAHALLAHDRLEFNEVGGNETVDASSKSGYFWLRAMKSWAGDVISETVLSAGRIDRDREGFSEPEDDLVIVDDNRTLDFFGLKNDVTWQVSDAHLLRFGLDVRRLDAKYRYTSGPADDVASQTSIRLDPEGTSIGGYISHRARIASGFATELGVRVDRQISGFQIQTSKKS